MAWDIENLQQLLNTHDGWLVSKEDGCVCITNEDGLDAYMAVSGSQIIVESILFSKQQVSDAAALNEEILKTHQVFPLTTVAMTNVDGEDYYMAFGALSAASKEESVMLEVEALFENVTGFLDAYEDYIA